MSKLVEKLERISEGGGQPLGFGAAVTRAKTAQMLVIASVPVTGAELAISATRGGADALLVTVENLEKESKALARIGHAKLDIPWGVYLETVTRKEVEKLVEMGCDFVIFGPAKTPATVLMEEKIGKILKIDTSLAEGLTRAVNRLQIDAVLISPAGSDEPSLTVHQLMLYERLAGGTGKHLLATLPPALSSGDVECMWGLGLRGVVFDMSAEQPEQRLSELKEAIQKLPAKRKKSREKIRATLPFPSAPPEKVEHEEEEEEEEP